MVYLVGPAGCGKSTLASVLSDVMESSGMKTITVNLDPGAEWLPYTPDIDIRKYVSLREVMKEFKLGPNGGLIVAVDLMVDHLPRLRQLIESWNVDYVLIDTPGQMELFAYRKTGPAVIEELGRDKSSALLFLVDAFFAKRASSFVSILMLASSVLARFRVPQINVLTKTDLLSEKELETAAGWIERKDLLLEAILAEPHPIDRESATAMLEVLERIGFAGELMPVSAVENQGILELVSGIERVFSAETKLDLGEEADKF